MIPEFNSTTNSNIFDSVRIMSGLAYRGSMWHGTIKSEVKNLVENLRDNNILKNTERKNNFEVEKLVAKIL